MQINNNPVSVNLNIEKTAPSRQRAETNTLETKDNFTKSNGSKAQDVQAMSLVSKLKKLALAPLVLFCDMPSLSNYETISEERKKKIMDTIKPGDIILETDNNYPGWQLMEKVAGKSEHTHAAIYEGNGVFIEATTGPGVTKTELKNYLKGRMVIQLIRPPYKSEADIKAALDYANKQIGKSYDDFFNYKDDSEMFCSELVAKSLRAMPDTIETPISTLLGHEFVLPDDFQKIEGAEVVYDDKTTFLKNQLSHAPTLIGGAVTAAAAAFALGPIGVAGAFIGGTLLTSIIGGCIQQKDAVKSFINDMFNHNKETNKQAKMKAD